MTCQNILLIGAGETYKTYMCERLQKTCQPDIYRATVYVNVYQVSGVKYPIFDIAGQPSFAGQRDLYFQQAGGVILMARSDKLNTIDRLNIEYEFIRQEYPNLPIRVLLVKLSQAQPVLPDDQLIERLPKDLVWYFLDIDTVSLDILKDILNSVIEV